MAKGASARWQPKDGASTAEAPRARRPAEDGKEATWTECITLEASSRRIRVAMSGRSLEDHDMERWCSWFRTHLEALAAEAGVSESSFLAKEVDFADNRLSGSGVKLLLEALRASRTSPPLIKLHHNRIRDGAAIASYIQNCRGSLRELQLSHNELDAQAAADILISAATAQQLDGRFSYPSQDQRGGPRPMWLRLEQNYISHAALLERLGGPELERLKRPGMAGKAVLCTVPRTACTPRHCMLNEDEQPAIHCKYLTNQKSREKRPEAKEGEVEKEWQPSDNDDHGSDEDDDEEGLGEKKLGGLVWKVKDKPAGIEEVEDDKHGDYQYPLEVMLVMKNLIAEDQAKAAPEEREAAAKKVPAAMKLDKPAVNEPVASISPPAPRERKNNREHRQREAAPSKEPPEQQEAAAEPSAALAEPAAQHAQQSNDATARPAEPAQGSPPPENSLAAALAAKLAAHPGLGEGLGSALAGIGETLRASAALPSGGNGASGGGGGGSSGAGGAAAKSGSIGPPPSGVVGAPAAFPRNQLPGAFGHMAADPRLYTAYAAQMAQAAQAAHATHAAAQAAAMAVAHQAFGQVNAKGGKGGGKGGNGAAGGAVGRKLQPGKEWAQLVAMLKSAPNHQLTIQELQTRADMPLLAAVQDGAAFLEMLSKVPSKDVRVTGAPGKEKVSLALGGQAGPRPEEEVEEEDDDDEEPFFAFNAKAAEFVPGTGGGKAAQGNGNREPFSFSAEAASFTPTLGKGGAKAGQQARPGAVAVGAAAKAKSKAQPSPKQSPKAGAAASPASAPRQTLPAAAPSADATSPKGSSSLTCPKHGWQYMDPKANVQGPFSLEQMSLWYDHKFFHDQLPLRCDKNEPFVPLKELFPPPLKPFASYPKRPKPLPGKT